MKKTTLFLLAFIALNSIYAQVYSYRTYSHTNYYYYHQYNGYDLAGDMFNSYQADKQKKELEAKMRAKVQQIKAYYETLGEYPQTVADGWHNVVILAGDEFIDDRKVYVEKNKITRVVYDDWYEVELSFSGPIKSGKTGLQVKNGVGAEQGLLEAYFINYIADPESRATPPLKPGRVTFWTNNPRYKEMYVWFEDARIDNFKQRYDFENPPVCTSDKEIVIIYKPGTYKYKISMSKGGSMVVNEGKVTIKENGCEIIQANYPEYMLSNKKKSSGCF